MKSNARVAVALALIGFACGGEEEPVDPGPQIVLETSVLEPSAIQASTIEAETIVGARNSSNSPAGLAGLGMIPAEATPGLDIYLVAAGNVTTFEFDVDGDGAAEAINVFFASGGATYLAWREDGRCRLTFHWNNVGWFFDAECGEDGGLVCRYEGGIECTLCDAELCAPCSFDDEEDPTKVACEEIVPPEPDPEPDVLIPPDIPREDILDTDVGEDISEDAPDTEPDVIVEPDTTPDVGPTGDCDPSCMAAPDATCCTTCGCGSGDCTPVCNGNYQWDCEVGCCFDYDLLECEGD
jgi:hypothetical protein